MDAVDPQRLGSLWEAAVGRERRPGWTRYSVRALPFMDRSRRARGLPAQRVNSGSGSARGLDHFTECMLCISA